MFQSIPRPSEKAMRFTRTDLAIILIISIFYSLFAFHDIGYNYAPQTGVTIKQKNSIVFEFSEPVDRMQYYLGRYKDRMLRVELKLSSDSDWEELDPNGFYTMQTIFQWGTLYTKKDCVAIRLTALTGRVELLEAAFMNGSDTGNIILPTNKDEHPVLYDETWMYPEEGWTFRTGDYFDEVYYSITAQDMLQGRPTTETTHPPLGKVLMSIGVAIFGMNPFGWRIVGVFLGVLMVPIMYLFGRDLTKRRWLGALTAFVFAFDFMHFVQTRIATIDTYIVFFTILMYYFMYRYTQLSFYDTSLRKTFVPLGACGVFMGCAIASKWTGVYGAAGLAAIFFATLYARYREYCYAVEHPKAVSNGIHSRDIFEAFKPNTVKTILFCLIAFIVVPAAIYVLSYIPFRGPTGEFWRDMINNQKNMFSFHWNLEDVHPYESKWYQWPLMIRPFLYEYHVSETAPVIEQTIKALGNPLVWWVGIPVSLFTLAYAVFKREKSAAFLSMAYMAELLPWCLVSRSTFIYHYFPSVPFIVLMIVLSLSLLRRRMPEKLWKGVTAGYGVGVLALFLLFLPILSGQPISQNFARTFLHWRSTWP